MTITKDNVEEYVLLRDYLITTMANLKEGHTLISDIKRIIKNTVNEDKYLTIINEYLNNSQKNAESIGLKKKILKAVAFKLGTKIIMHYHY